MRLKNAVLEARQKRQSTGMILLDVKNAFPSVWTDGLLAKMIRFQFPAYLILIIGEFCTDRTLFVQVGDGISPRKMINNGTPQGSCISPILYAIFIADLKLQKAVRTLLFADDTAFMAHGLQHRGIATKLRKAWEAIKRYCDKWRIQLNALKTEAILFSLDGKKRRRPPNNIVDIKPRPPRNNNEDNVQPLPDATPNDSDSELDFADPHSNDQDSVIGSDSENDDDSGDQEDMEPDLHYSKAIKYLGVVFDHKLRFAEHLRSVNHKAIAIISSLFPLLGKHSELSTRTKLLLYKQIVRPIITYASPVWASAAKYHHKPLQVTQNRALKMIFNLNRRTGTVFIHGRAEVMLLRQYYEQLNERFFERCATSIHPLVSALAT